MKNDNSHIVQLHDCVCSVVYAKPNTNVQLLYLSTNMEIDIVLAPLFQNLPY